MKKKAYNRFKYYLESIPDFIPKNKKKIKFYYGLVDKGLAGIGMFIYPTKKKLLQKIDSLNYKMIQTDNVEFVMQGNHNEKQLEILNEYKENWEKLYEDIIKFQKHNKIYYHWEYRTYNFYWRVLIIYANESVNEHLNLNPEIYNLEIDSIDGDDSLIEVKNILFNIKLVQNTIKHIQVTINDTNYYQAIEEITIKKKFHKGLKVGVLEKLNEIYNYKHPVFRKRTSLVRGIRTKYIEDTDRYSIDVEILYKGPKVKFFREPELTPKEAFERQYLDDENVKHYYQKIGSIDLPIDAKYMYPFYNVINVDNHIMILINDFKDEINYNLLYAENDIDIYFGRVKNILESLKETKVYLEKVLKPFFPVDYDSKFKEYLYSLVDEDKLFFMPWCRYHYHDHELINCFEKQHENVERLISIFDRFLKIKNSECIKLYYSPYDELFQKVDSSFAIKMMEELKMIEDGKFILGKTKIGAIRGITEALIENEIILSETLSNSSKIISRYLKCSMKRLPKVSKVSIDYKGKANEYIDIYLKSQKAFILEKKTQLKDNVKIELKQLISNDDTSKVFIRLFDYLEDDTTNYDNLILLQQRFKQYNRNKLLGINDSITELTKINKSLLELINEL